MRMLNSIITEVNPYARTYKQMSEIVANYSNQGFQFQLSNLLSLKMVNRKSKIWHLRKLQKLLVYLRKMLAMSNLMNLLFIWSGIMKKMVQILFKIQIVLQDCRQ